MQYANLTNTNGRDILLKTIGTYEIAMSPLAFISSFYSEVCFGDFRDSPLWQLRQALYMLNDDFGDFRARHPQREITWVAEHSEPTLGQDPQVPQMAIVDRLVEVVAQSDLYICILADARRGEKEHGSPVNIVNHVSATSFFEIELYTAAMYAKPVYLRMLDGFSPGPRLASLLRILESALPDWRAKKPMPAREILDEVRELIAGHIRQPKKPAPLRQHLVEEFYLARAAKAPPGHEMDNVLFLDGQFEKRQLPQKDLVESLVADCERVPEMDRKLSRMWLAARELMSAPYLPKDVQADNRLVDFLPLWDRVLGFWTSAASWSGWHGHIYAGTVAPLHSQAIVRMQIGGAHPPDGPLASAYYSIANLMPLGLRRLECFRRASQYIEEAIVLSKKQNPGQFAIRGSIRMRLGNIPGAVLDFKRMLNLRERQGASEEQVGDAMVHLGFAYLFCGRWLKGRDYLESGVRAMSNNLNNPGISRAKRKLALAYRLTGKSALARDVLKEADAHARRLGALDQVNR
jgi:hypothetical protein